MSDTEVVISSPKFCDLCAMRHVATVATVDGKTWAGPWANMCDSHFTDHGVGLGLGKGQRLIVSAR